MTPSRSKRSLSSTGVIINGDDFGRSAMINSAIVEAFARGWINSTSIMANMPGFEEAVQLTYECDLRSQVGVHLVLTSGEPLTKDIRVLPFLFNEQAPARRTMIKRLFLLNDREKELIFREFTAQIDAVRKNGIPVTHLDTHHQIHDVWSLCQIMIRLLEAYRIPGMRILNNLEPSPNPAKNLYRNIVNQYLRKKKVNRTDLFGSREGFIRRLCQDPDFAHYRKTEVMVHPVYNNRGELIDIAGDKEYALDLQSPRYGKTLNRASVVL